MEHCKFRTMDKCKNEECELLMCIGAENCIHFQPESKEKLEDTIPKWKIDKAIEKIEQKLYVDSLIFGELCDFKEGKISADDVIEKFNKVARKEVLEILKRNIGE